MIKSPKETVENSPPLSQTLSLEGERHHDPKWGVLHDPRDEKTGNEHLSDRQRVGQRPKNDPQMDSAIRTDLLPTSRQATKQAGPFKDYIRRRMEEGCLNANVIFDEIRDQGYTATKPFCVPLCSLSVHPS